jgi:RNA polymerase sigma factor (sigma-70 family)
MSGAGIATVSAQPATSDAKLVDGVRSGDETAFEELYRRYNRRIASFARGIVRDEARAEDVAQEAFLSALRRLRDTDAEIAFKPWIYEIARNAAIDSYRRTSRTEEVPMDSEELLRPSDRWRLAGTAVPDSAFVAKERLEHLQGALDELSDTHHRALVMRELEGLSYREIGERLELTRSAVESTLFRARRRLEREYEELDTGRRCKAMGMVMARLSNGMSSEREKRRLARHAARCGTCRKRARELGVEPLRRGIVARAAALLPLPAFLRRRVADAGGAMANSGQATGALGSVAQGAQFTAAISERAAAVVAAIALVGAGGAMLARVEPVGRQQSEAPVAPSSTKLAPAAPGLSFPRTIDPRGHGRGTDSGVSASPRGQHPGRSSSSPPAPAAGPPSSYQKRSAPPEERPAVRLPADPGPKPPTDDASTGTTVPSVTGGLDPAIAPAATPAVTPPKLDAPASPPAASGATAALASV